jgi:hypothetical protein
MPAALLLIVKVFVYSFWPQKNFSVIVIVSLFLLPLKLFDGSCRVALVASEEQGIRPGYRHKQIGVFIANTIDHVIRGCGSRSSYLSFDSSTGSTWFRGPLKFGLPVAYKGRPISVKFCLRLLPLPDHVWFNSYDNAVFRCVGGACRGVTAKSLW